jgi:single-strand DNA-binding protein
METESSVEVPVELNVAVVRGTCSSPAEVRELPSGDVLVQLQITTRVAGHGMSVPVSVVQPAVWVERADTGDELIVVGHVRRRFFRAGGATASRVEIAAEFLAPAHDRRRVRALRRRIDDALRPLEE